jgi:hypothetical protein
MSITMGIKLTGLHIYCHSNIIHYREDYTYPTNLHCGEIRLQIHTKTSHNLHNKQQGRFMAKYLTARAPDNDSSASSEIK